MPAAPPSLVPLIVGSALLMQQIDSTVLATALPAISGSLNTDPVTLNLAITSYLLSVAIFIPISGWVADRFGARAVFRAAILLFTLSSIACGLSQSLPELVAGRIVQGIGGAMMVPVGRLVILKTVQKSDLVRAMAYLTIPATMGPMLGPVVGGAIVTYGSWRWIFFMNGPIGLVGITLVTLYMQEIREEDTAPLDLPGFVLTGIGLAGLVFGFETIGRGLVPTTTTIAMLAGGGLCMTLYVFRARGIANPIIDLKLFRIPTFFASVVGGGISRFGQSSLPFLLAILLQLGFGLSPFASGMLTFTSALGALAMKFTVRPVIQRWGFRRVLIGDTIIIALFFVAYALFRPTTSHLWIVATLLAGGFFRTLQYNSLNSLTYADVPRDRMSRASSLASMAQQLNQSIGVGIAAALLHLSLTLRGTTEITTADVTPALLTIGALTASSVIFFIRMPAQAGAELSGHAARAAVPVDGGKPL